MDDLDDLLGPPRKRGPNAPPAPGKRRRGRPTKAEAAAHAAQKAKELGDKEPDAAVDGLGANALPDAGAFHRPVTRTFLATVLGMEPRRLVKKLAQCRIIGYAEGKASHGERVPLYDFKEAISYCVDPKIDLAAWIKTQTPTSLPPMISKAFWDAEASRQRVMRNAGDLWETQDVLDVLGRVAITIKTTAQLWIEGLPGKASMTSEQYDALRREVAALLDDIHQRLVTMPSGAHTRSSLGAIEDMIAADGAAGGED